VAGMLWPCTITKTSTQLVLLIGIFFTHLLFTNISLAATIIAANVLPVSEYTRITIESDQVLSYSTLTLKNPNRIVLDLKNTLEINKIKALSKKLLPSDTTIKQIRVGKFQQNTIRVVIDLRANATPKITQYMPASGYQYRLTLDIIPEQGALTSDEKSEEPPVKSSNSSQQEVDNGAKIILNREPVFESDLDIEPSQ
jgi:N-acetylmuramoyl-L-alanine amidase